MHCKYVYPSWEDGSNLTWLQSATSQVLLVDRLPASKKKACPSGNEEIGGCSMMNLLVLNAGNGWEWGLLGLSLMDHSLIPDLKHQ